jgi:hypothetical protein
MYFITYYYDLLNCIKVDLLWINEAVKEKTTVLLKF